MRSSSPADTDSRIASPAAAPAAIAGRRRWWLVILAAVAFALLVVAIMVLSVWFEVIMFPLLPTDAALAVSPVPPEAALPQLR